MTKAEAVDLLNRMEANAFFFDGFEDAIIGVGRQFTKEPVIVYDREKCIQILIDRDGMDREGAEEFFSVNTEGSWIGEQTPIVVETGSEA